MERKKFAFFKLYEKGFAVRFILLLLVLQLAQLTQAIEYLFLPSDDSLFSDCGKSSGLDLDDVISMDELDVVVADDHVEVGGDIKVVWDMKDTDRIEMSLEVLKNAHGEWQPTIFNMYFKDFCESFYSKDSALYTSWSQFIAEEDRECFTRKDHVFHHSPFMLDLKVDVDENISGKHKIVFDIVVFDETNQKKETACFELIGDINKA